jgi:hypothetical protein
VQAEQDPQGLKIFQAPCEIGSNQDSPILSVLFARRFFFSSLLAMPKADYMN